MHAGGLPIFTIIGILTTVAIAAGTAQYMGLIELRPAVVASVHGSSRGNAVPILGSNGQIVSYGSRGSLGSSEPPRTCIRSTLACAQAQARSDDGHTQL